MGVYRNVLLPLNIKDSLFGIKLSFADINNMSLSYCVTNEYFILNQRHAASSATEACAMYAEGYHYDASGKG